MIIVDAHEDLAWNILTFGRDYTRSVQTTRQKEAGGIAPKYNGDTLLGWQEYQKGRVAVVFATLFAPPMRASEGAWDNQCYKDSDEARVRYLAQMNAYHQLVSEHPDKFRLVRTKNELEKVLSRWEPEETTAAPAPVGLVVSMEGAEGLRTPDELQGWWESGLRLIGLAWAGNQYCGGTREPGALTDAGYALLEEMGRIGFGLDISHMDEASVLPALDFYAGQIIASHANAKALLKGDDSNRHLSDRVIHGIIERDGVIGVVFYNHFLNPAWKHGDAREMVTLHDVVAQIDYICQLAGDARHVGIGTDFDGGLGVQSVPDGIDSIADLQKLIPLLEEKGYKIEDIEAIMGKNWIARLQNILPQE